MADDDRLKLLEDRLTRIEAALTQRGPIGGGGGVTPPGGGVVVDPAPHPYAGVAQFRRAVPSPVVDPAPWWAGGYGRPRWPWPSPVVDPAPWPPQYITDPAPWPPHYISDPAPSPYTNVAANPAVSAMAFGRVGPIGDPAPPDFGALSISQLESTLHSLNAERARLESLENTIKQQIERVKAKGPQR
jgi:hypothetical protein